LVSGAQFVVDPANGRVSFITGTHGFRFVPDNASDLVFIAGGVDRIILRRQGNDGLDIRSTSSLHAHFSSTGTLIGGGAGVTDRSQRLSHFHTIPNYNSTGDLGGIGYGFSVASATYNNATTLRSGAITSFNTLVGGSGYTNGTYTGIALTGGTGTGATANITVSGGAVTVVTVNASGSGYTSGNTLSAANTIIGGGSGSGFSINVAIVASNVVAAASFVSFGGGTMTSTTPGVVYSNFSTLRIAGPPTAGTNSTITKPWAFRVESGASYFGGSIQTVSTFASVSSVSNGNYSTLLWQGDNTGSVYQNNVFNFQSGGLSKGFGFSSNTGATVFYINTESGTLSGVGIGTALTGIAASALLDMQSVSKGLLIPRGTDANIAAVASPALALQMFSTTSERINVKRTDGFYQIAYVQDIKKDTTYKTVNSNLDLSGLTTTFANRYKRVVVETIVTASATGNNTVTLPVPSAALLNTKFEISVEDTSGDGDISVLNFGTDGTDGYLYNGDGTYQVTQNLFPGIGVYVSVSWCEAKGAYRWKLQ